MSESRTVTLDDVARAAGVSVSTASRTLNGRPGRVSEETKDRVRSVAQRLGYAPNLAAQAVALGRSKSIGLIVGDVPDDYQNPVLAGVFRAASRRGMLVTTAVTETSDVARTRDAVRQLRGQRPAVVFYVGTEAPDGRGMSELTDELSLVEREGGRVVLVGIAGTPFDCVTVDDRKAGAAMATSLIELGYRDLVVFAGRGEGLLSTHRVEGFVGELERQGIPMRADGVIWHDFDHDGGYRAAGELLRRRPRTEAVFCVNDAMAIGASVRFREAGLMIGVDIAVAGCDDIPALRDIDPPLTSIHLPWVEAAERAFELSENAASAGRVVTLEGYPIIRTSTPGISRERVES